MLIDFSSDIQLLKDMEQAFTKAEQNHDSIQQLMIIKAVQVRVEQLLEDLEDYAQRIQPAAVRDTIEVYRKNNP